MMRIGTFLMNSLISSLKYQMAQLASKAKLIKKGWTILKITLMSIYCYSLVPVTPHIQNYRGYFNIMLYCEENPPDLPKKPFLLVISVLATLFELGKGMYCNLMMYIFVKKRNSVQNQGASLIPWKSSNSNQDEDLQIPTRATIVMSMIFIVVCVISVVFISLTWGNETDPQLFTWAFLLNNTCATFVPIILVIFTVKQQSKVKTSQPPKGLQFHENEIFVISSPVLNDNAIELQSL